MIKKNLDQIALKNNSDFQEASSITEVKLLLQQNESEDLSFLQSAFPNSVNSKIVISNSDNEQVKKLSSMHNGDVYTTDQLKSICMKYRLRFLPSTLYKGNIPVDVIHDIRNKMKGDEKLKYLSSGSATIYQRNLFMMAPASMFNIESVVSKKKAELAEIKRLRDLDPAVFIKVDDDKYLFVREFGNSFSPLRRILGALTAQSQSLNIMFFLGWLLCTYLYKILILTPVFHAFVMAEKGSLAEVGWIFLFLISIVTGSIIAVGAASSGSFSIILATIKERNKAWFRLDKRFATEYNWNDSGHSFNDF